MFKRLAVIGWDAASFTILEPMLARGELPNLAGLLARGASGPIETVPNMNSGPAWSSIVTGLNPGRHGVYHLADFIPGTYRVRPVNASDRRGETIWRYVDRAGGRVVVINVPISYPADELRGVHISGMDAPHLGAPGVAHPPQILDQLQAHHAGYTLVPDADRQIRAGHPEAALASILQAIDQRAAAGLHLIRSQVWDYFMLVFMASDIVQHFFWPAEGQELPGEAIGAVFRRLDEVLGQFLSALDHDTGVILLSDHGAGATPKVAGLVNDVLAAHGWLSFRQRSGLRTRLFRFAYGWMSRLLPKGLRARISRQLSGLTSRAFSDLVFQDIDWSNTLAFKPGGRDEIRINLRGREPYGVVDPTQYETVMEQVKRALMNLRDPDSGQPVVEWVRRREELYQGPFTEKAADLTIRWQYDHAPQGVQFEVQGQPFELRESRQRRMVLTTGEHRPQGIFVAAGPGIRAGSAPEQARLIDFFPTALAMMNAPIPGHLDGRVLEEIFEPSFLERHPLRFAEGEFEEADPEARGYNPEEEAEIKRRLGELGYLD